MRFEAVIGLEIHAQLKTNSKIFCGCKPVFGDEPNTHGCPVCLGLPGSLPVLNRRVVRMAIKAGRAVNCSIARKSIFARKNYFYPDLPKGYQISQYDMPLCENGHLTVTVDGKKKRIGITRIHLEEDAGKLIHDQDIDSLFDVNRCGTPLVEIVSEPDMRTPQEAYAYLTALKQILEYLDISDCNMEEGSLRCDANVSIRPQGQTTLGTKTELKNMNSFRGVEKALEYEIMRQTEVVQSGGAVIQQTFLWDANKNRTVAMRTKEHAHDYRYFPDPDLVALIVEDSWVTDIERDMPELPQARLERFRAQYGLNEEHAAVLVDSRALADYFEKAVEASAGEVKVTANWVMSTVLRLSKDSKTTVDRLQLTPDRLAAVIKLFKEGTISDSAAKKVMLAVEEQGKEPCEIVDALGLRQISDTGELEKIVDDLLTKHPDEAERLKGGEKKLTGFFVGQAMKATQGKGNPREISKLLAQKLG
ncbi:MAG: Asp-tRNA(Asn)/Glu-tRNA(Gln) amidotransferase subunit GatB [Chitinispirillaceae bacterium]